MTEIKATRNVIYNGILYKTGENVPVEDEDLTTINRWFGATPNPPPAPYVPPKIPPNDDLLVVEEGLPPLEDEPRKKGKKNV